MSTKLPSRRIKKKLGTIFGYVLLAIILIWFVFPLYWTFATSVKQKGEFFSSPPLLFSRQPTLKNYTEVFEDGSLIYLKNSIIAVTFSSLSAIVLGSLAAYGLARIKPSWSKKYALWVLSLRLFPPIAIILPLFLMMKNLHLIDTYWSLIMVYTMFNLSFAVWILRAFFEDIPSELDESAFLDGCSHLGVFFKIIIPITKTGILTTAIFCSIFSWNEFLFATILTRSITKTFVVHVASYRGSQNLNLGAISALCILGTVPIITLFLLTRRHFIRGITLGAIKD